MVEHGRNRITRTHGQCLNRRIHDIETIKSEAAAWQNHRNNKCATINWQFKNEQARIKLKNFIRQLMCDITLGDKFILFTTIEFITLF